MSLNDDEMGGRQKPILKRGFQRYEEEPESGDSGACSGDELERPDTPMGTLGRGTPRPSLTSSRIVFSFCPTHNIFDLERKPDKDRTLQR